MLSSSPLFAIAGTAIGTAILEKILSRSGHDDFIPFVNLVGWMVAGYLTLDWAREMIDATARIF